MSINEIWKHLGCNDPNLIKNFVDWKTENAWYSSNNFKITCECDFAVSHSGPTISNAENNQQTYPTHIKMPVMIYVGRKVNK